jgi:hypothetical protein
LIADFLRFAACCLALAVSRDRTKIRISSSASFHNRSVFDPAHVPNSVYTSSQSADSSTSSIAPLSLLMKSASINDQESPTNP